MNELKLPSTTFQSYWGGEYRSIRCRLHRVHIVIDGNHTRHFNPAMHLGGFHSQKVEEESKKKKIPLYPIHIQNDKIEIKPYSDINYHGLCICLNLSIFIIFIRIARFVLKFPNIDI